MYGFILQSFVDYLVANFPAEMVDEIIFTADNMDNRRTSESGSSTKSNDIIPRYRHLYFRGFSTYKPYGDEMLVGLLRSASAVVQMPSLTLLEQFGIHIFKFIMDESGFRKVMDLSGRDFADFLVHLDFMHEYLRYSFPTIRPPSFTILDQTPDGMKIAYKTSRKGFHCFATTLLKLVAEKYYGLSINITTNDQEAESNHRKYIETIINLEFDNVNHYVKQRKTRCCIESLKLAVLRPERVFGQLMPFHIAFIERNLEIVSIGKSLAMLLNDIIGAEFLSHFTILLPKQANWSWQEIGLNGQHMFTIECKIQSKSTETSTDAPLKLRLRGQMIYFKQFNCIIFNGVPFLKELEDLAKFGLKGASLPKTDASRFILSIALQRRQPTTRTTITKLENEIDKSLGSRFFLEYDRRIMLQDTVPRPLVPLIEQTGKVDDAEVNRGFVGTVTVVFSIDQPSSHSSGGVLIKERLVHLNNLVEKMARICDKYNLAKLPSGSQEFTLVAGLPVESKSSVNCVVLAAVELLAFQAKTRVKKQQPVAPDSHMPNLLMAVDCGEASASLVSLERVNYYHLVGEAASRTQRFAPLCTPNTINVTANVTEWIANSEYANEYDFTKIVLDSNEAANKSKLANRGPKAKPIELFQLTRFPGKEIIDAAQNGEEVNDIDNLFSDNTNTGNKMESKQSLSELTDFTSKAEKRRLDGITFEGDKQNNESGDKNSNHMLETTEFSEDEVWVDDSHRRSATPRAKHPPSNQKTKKGDVAKVKSKSVDGGSLVKTSSEADDDNQSDFSSSSRRPSVDRAELAKYAATVTDDLQKNNAEQGETARSPKSSEANGSNKYKKISSDDGSNNENDELHVPIVRNGRKCVPNDTCVIS